MINQNRGECMSVALCDKTFTGETSADFTLPDYRAEIRRILHVFPTVLPPAKYVGDDSAEFNGTVDYQVLYIGGDGELYCVPLSSEYSFSVPFDKDAEKDADNIFALCSVSAENVSTRVSAPRRLSIRTRLRQNVRICGSVSSVCESEGGVSADSIFTREQSIPTLAGECVSSDIVSLSYTAPLASEDTRVVWADSKVTVEDTRAEKGALDCRCCLRIELLCITEDGKYTVTEGKVPFECVIDAERTTEEYAAAVKGYVTQMTVNVTDAGIECAAEVMLEAACMRNEQSVYTDDVYSSERECRCDSRQISTHDMLYCGGGSFTLSERIPIAESGIPENAEILCTTGSGCMTRCESEGNKYTFSGQAELTLLCSVDGEVGAYDIKLPMKYEVSSQSSGEVVYFDAFAEATDIKARISDGNLCIDAEMHFCGDCLGENTVSTVSKVTFGETVSARESELIVCYPAPDDSAWSVAKRYAVSPDAVIGTPQTDRYVIIE